MKIICFENLERENNIVEIFGLAKSGKTLLFKELIKKGYKGLSHEEISTAQKILFFLEFFLKRPLNTIYFFYKTNTNWIKLKSLAFKDYFEIFKMRNSYLAAVLSKYEIAKKYKRKILVDEFLLQSLFMILHKKANEQEIRKIMEKMPHSGDILLVEESRKKRLNRLRNRKTPARNLNKEFLEIWWTNIEFNYNIVKRMILKKYKKSKQKLMFSINPEF